MKKTTPTILMMVWLLGTACSGFAADYNAELQRAYNLMLAGELAAGDEIYQQLLRSESIPRYKIYFSKALADINRLDLLSSEANYNLALQELQCNPERADIVMEFDYRRAALLITKGESGRALTILQPYVFRPQANVRMQSDYVDAHFRLGHYMQAVLAADQFWNGKYESIPTYGLARLADSLFKMQQYQRAQDIYEVVLKREPQNFFAGLSRAYCLALSNRDEDALAGYVACYKLRPDKEQLLIEEANALLGKDKKHLASAIYAYLQTESKNNELVKLARAQALSRIGHRQAAERLLTEVDSTQRYREQVLWQRFQNKMTEELYADAYHYLGQLRGSSYYAEAQNMYAKLRQGGLETSYSTTANYKGNSLSSYAMAGDVYLGGNTWVTAGVANARLSDKINTATVNSSSVGLVHRFARGSIGGTIINAVAGGAHTLYNVTGQYKVNDLTTVQATVGKRYIGFAKAVLHDFITEDYYTLALTNRFNQRNSWGIEYTGSSLTDGNRFYGYGLQYNYLAVKDPKKTHEFFGYYRRSGFNKTSDYYESPDKRLAWGGGWQAHWYADNSAYWQVRVNLEFGHDNQEPTDLSPSVRVKYMYPLGRKQELGVAAEYGVRTDRLNGSNSFRHGYKQLELMYSLNW